MRKSIIKIIAASALCFAIAAPGCASKPQEPASPQAEASATPTATETQAVESRDTAQADDASAQPSQASFFTAPLDEEVVVEGVTFPYSSTWEKKDAGGAVEFTSGGQYPDMVIIAARPISDINTGADLKYSFESMSADEIADALKEVAAAAAADEGGEIDMAETGAIEYYPGLLYAYSSPETETRVIGVLATDGNTMYDLRAVATAGYAGSSAKAEDAENLIRDMSFMAKSSGLDFNEDPFYAQPGQSGFNFDSVDGVNAGTDAVFQITNSSVDSSLPGTIETGPSFGSIMEELNDDNSIEFMGVRLRIPDGWQTRGKADDKFSMILPDNSDVRISILGGTPEEIGIYGTPQAWLDAEYDDVAKNVKNKVLTIKQTGVCRAGDVYEIVWAGEEDDGLSLGADALIAGANGTYYRFSMAYPIAGGYAGSSDSLADRVNEAIGRFSEVVFLAAPV